jgi:hypothetical protein
LLYGRFAKSLLSDLQGGQVLSNVQQTAIVPKNIKKATPIKIYKICKLDAYDQRSLKFPLTIIF